MRKHKKTPANALTTIAEHARELLTVTAGVAGDNISEARERLSAALERGKEVYEDVSEQAVSRVKATDKFIRKNPYAALGIGLGIGFIIGLLFRSGPED